MKQPERELSATYRSPSTIDRIDITVIQRRKYAPHQINELKNLPAYMKKSIEHLTCKIIREFSQIWKNGNIFLMATYGSLKNSIGNQVSIYK